MKPLAKALKNKVIGATANVLSAYPQYKAFKAKRQADYDVQALRTARAYDNAPNFENGQITDAFKARSLAQEVRDRLLKKQTQ